MLDPKDFVLYWGCWDRAGHFLWTPGHNYVREGLDDRHLLVPRASQLDGSYIFLPRPEQPGDGALTYLPATDRTVLAWWGNPWDTRGAVNSAVISSGWYKAEELWARFATRFPTLAPRLTFPRVVAHSTWVTR